MGQKIPLRNVKLPEWFCQELQSVLGIKPKVAVYDNGNRKELLVITEQNENFACGYMDNFMVYSARPKRGLETIHHIRNAPLEKISFDLSTEVYIS